MTTTLSFIAVLGILVLIHESGHFLVAKAMGVGVDRFSIGFPPKMFGIKKGDTEYCVSWIPVGGYVKLRGEDPDELTDPHDPKLYSTRSPGQRAGIIVAGPVMNLVLAFILMPMMFMIGINIPAFFEEPVNVGWVSPDSPAEMAGVRVGDIVVGFNGERTNDWEALFKAMSVNTGPTATIDLLRDGRSLSAVVKGKDLKGDGGLGAYPPMAPVVGSLSPGYPAEKAGIKEGDLILSVGGLPVTHWNEMARVIHGNPDKAITVAVKRGTERIRVQVTPRLDEKTGQGFIGISPESETITRRFGFLESISRGFKRNVELLKLTFSFLWELITLHASIKFLGGPIMIFQVTGQAARAGLSEFIAFMAFLSLQLGILNLLPIPVLDGGHLFFLGLEKLKGKPIDPNVRETAQRIGFALLIILIVVVSYNDILRIFSSR
ncbi:MAG TPA: RIP metalloprotease RseP [Proteobacteria bacterium]|nr:putative zinc metalloprotease [bacterium BMS3Abin14]HDL53882.1 RIP metalloprotease RseP [Pseudomonadota bacterium]